MLLLFGLVFDRHRTCYAPQIDPMPLSRSRIKHCLHVVSYKCLVQRPGMVLDHIQRLLVHLSGIVRVYSVETVLLQVICSQPDATANREPATLLCEIRHFKLCLGHSECTS